LGKVAIVTGGSRGIGAATSRTLARQGYDVGVVYRHDSGAANRIVDQCRATGMRASSFAGDVGEEADVVRVFRQVTMTTGLAKEVASEGIRVNAVRPGIVATDIHASGGQPDRAQ
jgi:NAD(P)-dependent dehydrogenase (short-subunit alcohol dehydrogenase family)